MATSAGISREIERVVERVAVRITLSLQQNLEDTTPVDTSWARANWVPALGSPFLRGRTFLDANPTPQAAGVQAQFQSAARATVPGYRLASGPLFVTNNAPYINELNDGKSPQAPAFFVQRAIAKAVTDDIRGLRT